jgi:TldD protein
MRDRLADALRSGKNSADYIDIRVEDVTSTWIWYRGQELDNIGSSRTTGGIVRALSRGGWGYATFNDLENLGKRVSEACEAAHLVGQGTTMFASLEPVVAANHAEMEKDFRPVPLAEKQKLLEGYNNQVMQFHPSIQTTSTGYGDRFRKIWFASSEGAYIEDEQPNIYVFTSATARRDDLVQSAFEMQGGSQGFGDVLGFEEKAAGAARRAVDLLEAPVVQGGKYTVVLDPLLAGVFAHEAFGHLSEADFIYENERMKELMRLGKRFGSDILNIIDDGSYEGGLGTHPYDFEGTPTQKTYLIRDGILVGRLHSRETAGKMGEMPTGNARSIGYQYQPIVRMTNTYIDRGSASFEEMIRETPLGVYALNLIGGQTSAEMFTFSAGYAYMIRDGQIAEMVRDVTLTGNVFDTLMNIDRVGSDLTWTPNGPGGCGKGAQSPLRVGIGGPHVRIHNVVVGGKQ